MNDLMKMLNRVMLFVEDYRSIPALMFWPKFSITSFLMVSRLSKQGIRPKTVLDVGANVGQFAVASSKLFPEVQVHSFEPSPETAKILKKNVSRLKNVTVYPIALGSQEGEVAFHVNAHSHSSSILPLAQAQVDAFPFLRETETITVKLSTLDKVLSDVDFISPVLLKLDVQGFEAQVIQGSTEILKKVDYVVLETSFKPLYEGELLFMDIIQLMEKRGFTFSRPLDFLIAPGNGEILQMDAFFVRR